MFPIHSCSLNNALTLNTDGNAVFLTCVHLFYFTSLIFRGSLESSVSCQQTDLIPATASQSTLSILVLTETWIHSEDSAAPSVLSNNFPFSIYCLPGQLGTFIEELDGLLSSFSGDGSPLVVFGDFNIHLKKPYTADFHSLTIVSQTTFWENL